MILNHKFSWKRFFILILVASSLSACAEVKKVFSIFFSKHSSLNTSGFEVAEMSSGDGVTCSIMGDKTVRCLGTGTQGDLGRFHGAQNNNLKDIKQIALGKGFTCAIIGEKSELKCFGINDKGQLGNPNQQSSIDPVPVLDTENNNTPISDAKQVTAGENHACALLKSGRAICWGDNSYGQIGNPQPEGVQVKTVMQDGKPPKAFESIQSITAGGNSTCITAKDDFTLFCFGDRYGITKGNNWVPSKIELAGGIVPLSQIKQVGLGNGFGCALSRSQVFCWGNNEFKQLGAAIDASGTTKASAVEVHYPLNAPISKIEAIAVGDKHACALHRDENTIYCWGDNTFGQLGTTSMHGLPEQVAVGTSNLTLKGAKYIAAGKERTCIISSSDELFCWGNGAHGILGNETLNTPFPTRVLDSNNEMISGSLSVAIGADHACVVGINKKIFCFGLNQNGQLGSRIITSTALSNVSVMDTYGHKTCLIYGDKKTVGCFGGVELSSNTENTVNSFSIEEVKGALKPFNESISVSVGLNHICIVNSDQQVECIDYETKPPNHVLIQTDKNAPLKDIWHVRSRGKWNCGLTREKGEVWCWGDWKKNQWPAAKQLNFAGKPTKDFIQISMNEDQICGINGVSGIIYCSVDAEISQNAINLQVISDSKGLPFSGVFSLSSGKNHTCALNDKNQLYCWGSNEFGQLGVSSLASSSIPLRVTIKNESHRKITRVSAGDYHTCFSTEVEMSLFCFGKSFYHEANSPAPIEYPL